MPVDISSLPAADREDFQKRLQVYGLDINAVQEPLSVTGSSTVNLVYGSCSGSWFEADYG
jgi:hypothetical protein